MRVQVLFTRPAAESMQVALSCKHIADTWQGSYMATREAIETAGRDPRWEFSKQVLFERTNYMGEICGDLASMLETVDDFRKFLGPELKAVTGDTQVRLETAFGLVLPVFWLKLQSTEPACKPAAGATGQCK